MHYSNEVEENSIEFKSSALKKYSSFVTVNNSASFLNRLYYSKISALLEATVNISNTGLYFILFVEYNLKKITFLGS